MGVFGTGIQTASMRMSLKPGRNSEMVNLKKCSTGSKSQGNLAAEKYSPSYSVGMHYKKDGEGYSL